MHSVLTLKICRECKRPLPLTEYHIHNGCRDGLQPKCKECVKVYRSQYYQKHADRLREYSSSFYKENADDIKNYQKRYAEKHSRKVKERNAKWRAANRDKLLLGKKIYYQQNKERDQHKYAAYRKDHHEYARLSCSARRSRLKNAPGKCSADQLFAKCEYHGWRCYLCQRSLTIQTVQMDHRSPLARGGSNWPANLAPACGPCNLSKSHKTEAEFRLFLSKNFLGNLSRLG